MQKKWTLEEISELKRLRSEGFSPKEISIKLNRTHDSILRKSDRINLSFLVPDLNSGDRFNKFTIINKIDRTIKGHSTSYLCLCDCGIEFELGRNSILSGNSVSCGCIRRNKLFKPNGEAGKNKLYSLCKGNARTRKLEFSLSREEHGFIISQDCYHCGTPPIPYNPYLCKDGAKRKNSVTDDETIKRAWIVSNTVDRIDSKRGYAIDNCVPSCWPCNKMKGDFANDDFLSYCCRVMEFQEKKKREKAS